MPKIYIFVVFLASFIIMCASNRPLAKPFQEGNVNYILLETRVDNIDDQKNIRVIFFIPVADSLNFAGVNYRTALLQSGIGDTLNPDFITGALSDSIKIGALLPRIETVHFKPDRDRGQKRNEIDRHFKKLKKKLIKRFYARYEFWGLERIVP